MVILFIDLVRASIGPFLSSHVFFRSQKNVHHLIFLQRQRKITQNRQARAKETSRASKPIIPPEKKECQYIRVQLLFSLLASSFVSSGLQLICRRTIFDEANDVEVRLSGCVPTRSSSREKKWFPLNPNSGRRVKNRRQWFVPCPSSSDTAVWVLQDSCQSMVIRALSAQGVLLALCAFLYTNTYIEQNS